MSWTGANYLLNMFRNKRGELNVNQDDVFHATGNISLAFLYFCKNLVAEVIENEK